MLLAAYLLVVVPLVAVALAATWVPRWWQVVLLLAGPVLTVLALLGVPGVDRLGFWLVVGAPWTLLVVLPLLPWRREWARHAVPVTVVALCALLVGVGRGHPPFLAYVVLPVVFSLGAFGVAELSRRDRRRAATTPG